MGLEITAADGIDVLVDVGETEALKSTPPLTTARALSRYFWDLSDAESLGNPMVLAAVRSKLPVGSLSCVHGPMRSGALGEKLLQPPVSWPMDHASPDPLACQQLSRFISRVVV